jgi:serine protease AprX
VLKAASRIVALPLAFTMIMAGNPGPGSASGDATAFDADAPRMIVTFNELPDDASARFVRAGITHAVMFPSVDAAAVVGPESAYRKIAAWDDVVEVTPDAPLRLYMWQATETTRVDLVRAGVRPLKSAYTGQGVTVAVVDTGIDTTHPDLAGDKVVANLDFTPARLFDPTNGDPTDLDQWDPIVRDPVSVPTGVDDSLPFGHGTFLASVVGGTGAAARGADMRGVAPDAKLVNLDVGDQFAYPSSIIAAFEWLIAHKDDPEFPGGIRVAVGGWGSECNPIPCEMPLQRALLDRVIAAGVVVVLPAAPAADGDITYPARYPEMIAVKGACKDQDDWSGWCGEGQASGAEYENTSTDLVAPSVDVWVALATQGRWQGFNPTGLQVVPPPGEGNQEDEINNRTWYGWAVSISLAAAHVAGIAALMIDANPDLTHADVEQILQRTARDLGANGFDERTGYGMADALRAVKAAERLGGHAGR